MYIYVHRQILHMIHIGMWCIYIYVYVSNIYMHTYIEYPAIVFEANAKACCACSTKIIGLFCRIQSLL